MYKVKHTQHMIVKVTILLNRLTIFFNYLVTELSIAFFNHKSVHNCCTAQTCHITAVGKLCMACGVCTVKFVLKQENITSDLAFLS